MTMLLIYEALEQERIKWDDIVTVSAHAASMGGSQVYLEQGEQQTVRDLVKSIVIASANDASVAMAEFIAGSEESFVLMMNNKAAALGMKDTFFKNSCGLDAPGHGV
jgi:D-alanyl-D-alanine carboxypeptidase (penicillin-binding protein 5/6)